MHRTEILMRTKSEARRQAIIEAATSVFHETGYELASMSEIAARVGGSKATLYNYFPSKESLFTAVVQGVAEREFGKLFTVLKPSDNLSAVLQTYGEQYLDTILSPTMLSLRRTVQHEADRNNVGRLVFEHGPKAVWTALADFLRSSMEAKQLRTTDPWVAAMHLRALIESELLDYHLLDVAEDVAHKSRAEVVARALEVFLAGYRR